MQLLGLNVPQEAWLQYKCVCVCKCMIQLSV